MKLFYIRDDYNNGYRVWRSDWFNDQFEILSHEQFEKLKEAIAPFFQLEEKDE